ncbi:MAG: tripartite tricarboxylate transporter substrate binding protein [Polaromonas sp.]|nr:tripartite tricarboxylate transporter substrate binding protein [Polaromonas sp.]MBP6089284.1 tripartite tricarboxylate transporter substrate binding protein [Polaromonas sp.]MBP7115454.1 tripartite tricarboxylate transporter substrate binding protein [Polaromonas sp.]MBP8874524.1 tripartite tricarboxylate transporter substrate binding protein [Polaromonas sp.]MBP9831206.1 tripartite tricarboxylate transporter substrate binding protein [Polaromonas sp.]
MVDSKHPSLSFFKSLVCVSALTLSFVANLAQAQTAANFPNKTIKIVVPFGAGGIADLTARTVGAKMAEFLGQAVVIENKPGAGGIAAGELVAKSEPDGSTLLLMSNGTAVSASLFKSLPFDTVKDFAPVSTLGFFDIALVTKADSPFKTLADLLSFAKANPGKLNVGTINIGSTQNLAAELFKSTASINVQIVPFNGTPAVITALRGGQIDAAVEILGPVKTQIDAKAIHALAVMGLKRAPSMPNVPTAKESGVTNMNAASWNALAVSAKTPKDIVAKLNVAVTAALVSADVKQKLDSLGVEAVASRPEVLGELLNAEIKRWGEVITRANIPKQ